MKHLRKAQQLYFSQYFTHITFSLVYKCHILFSSILYKMYMKRLPMVDLRILVCNDLSFFRSEDWRIESLLKH